MAAKKGTRGKGFEGSGVREFLPGPERESLIS
jgi:hypothetical protein